MTNDKTYDPLPQTILVPQGAEYKAVCRGLSRVKPPNLQVLPIPVGPKPLARLLEQWQQTGYGLKEASPRVVIMGLCGSLSPHLSVGDVVLYQACIDATNSSTPRLKPCDDELTTLLQHKLKTQSSLVKALTSDRIIVSAQEKHHLAQIYNTEVVDMEGFTALDVLSSAGIAVSMVRVVSDDVHHDLPNLTSAISSDGSLQPLPLVMGMIRQPMAATRLIRGAIHGLGVLQEVTRQLFSQ